MSQNSESSTEQPQTSPGNDLPMIAAPEGGSGSPPAAPAVPANKGRFNGQVACAAGAVLAVLAGMWLFSPTGFDPVFAVLHAMWHAIASGVGAAFPLLVADIPWFPTLCIVGGLAAYCGCRYARSGAHEKPFIVLLSILLWLGVIYVIGGPANMDLEVLFRNISLVTFVFCVALMKGLAIKRPDNDVSGFVEFLAVVTCGAAIVLQVMNWFDAANTMPDVTAEVQAKYGSELVEMGFEDTNREDTDVGGVCGSIDTVFRDGKAGRLDPVDVWPSDHGSDNKPSCLALRMRAGRLTLIVPDAPAHKATREETRQAALNAVDQTMTMIRKEYGVVENNKAVADSWNH